MSIHLACRNLKEKRTEEIGAGGFANKGVFDCMFLVFCFVFKDGKDAGMLIKRR